MKSILFSKKYIITLICVLLNTPFIFSQQTNEANLSKYWHYRYRLTHYFMVIGGGAGESIPADIRNLYNGSTLHWGEGPVQLGYYIGVLATEYHLLKRNYQNVDQTLTELYYALKAIERIDYYAEPNWSVNSSVNGFMYRDDVPDDFLNVNIHPDHETLNLSLTQNGVTSGSGEPAIVNNVESDYKSGFADNKQWAASQDQLYNLLMGLALVKRFVDPDNAGLTFFNTKTNTSMNYGFNSFTTEEADHIVSYIKHNPFVGPDNSWSLYYPNGTDIDDGHGGNAQLYSYGVAEAGKFITGIDYQNTSSQLERPQWNNYAGDQCVRWSFSHVSLPLILSSIGDSWAELQPVWIPFIIDGIEFPALGYWDTQWINKTKEGINYQGDYNSGNCFGYYYANHYGWNLFYGAVHRTLHWGNFWDSPSLDMCQIKDMLDKAPQEGPYYHNPADLAPDKWAASRRFYDEPPRQDQGSFDPNGYPCFQGNYNGLDYMLMHNLYYCMNETGEDYISKVMPTDHQDYIWQQPGIHYTVGDPYIDYNVYHPILVEYTTIADFGGAIFGSAVIVGGAQGVTLGDNVTVAEGAELDVHIDEQCSANPNSYLFNQSDYKTMLANNNNASSESLPLVSNYVMSDEFKLQNSNSKAISIFPNPSNGKFQINLTKNGKAIGVKEIKVVDVMGKAVWQKAVLTNNVFDVDITNYSQGIYYVRSINEQGEIEVQKLVKQ